MSTTAPSPTFTGSLPSSEEEKQRLTWENIPQNMSVAQYGCAATAVGNQFLLFGGYNSSGYLSTADALDVDTGSWSALPPMPTPRRFCAAVTVDGCAIVLGGYNREPLGTVEMIDMTTKKWTTLPSMPTPRNGCVAVVVENQIIVVGGYSGSDYLETVEMYNTDTGIWTSLPPMSTPRSHFEAVVVEKNVYIFGGEGDGETTSEMLDTRTQEWTALPAMPFCHVYGSAVAIRKQIVLLGGLDDSSEALERADVFDTETYQWSSLPPMTTKRVHCSAAFVQNQIIVAAGQDEESQSLNTTERMFVPITSLSGLPAPPEIPSVPADFGKLQRETLLQQWMETAVVIKNKYLNKVEEKKQSITGTVKLKKEELDEQFRDFEAAIKAKKEELDKEFCAFEESNGKLLKELEEMKAGWVEMMNGRIKDTKDQLDHLVPQSNPPASSKSDTPAAPTDDGTTTEKGDDPPAHLLCPITGKLMHDPVLAADGQTYERSAIEQYISQVPEGQDVQSPVKGDILESRSVFPNDFIRKLIHSYQGW